MARFETAARLHGRTRLPVHNHLLGHRESAEISCEPVFDGRWLLDERNCHDHTGPVTFYLEPHKADSSLFPSTQRPSEAVTLQADTLDRIVAERLGQGTVVAMKLDSEGGEPEVLLGAPRTLARCSFAGLDAGRERLGQSTMTECTRILRDSGFECRQICGSENLIAKR